MCLQFMRTSYDFLLLLVSSSESKPYGDEDRTEIVDFKWKIFRRLVEIVQSTRKVHEESIRLLTELCYCSLHTIAVQTPHDHPKCLRFSYDFRTQMIIKKSCVDRSIIAGALYDALRRV